MFRKALAALLLGVVVWVNPSLAQPLSDEEEIVVEAGQVLKEIMAIPAKGIPRSLLAEAQGLVIVPGMLRGGFIIGFKHGRGIALSREADGTWGNPIFIQITGGNLGFQAGLQATDLILVFRNKTTVESMMRGRFTIGANAAASAGPVGRSMSAATDGRMKSEILSYSRSRGLFAGVALDGAVIEPDSRATAAFYHQTPASPQGRAPAVAGQFLRLLNAQTGAPAEVAIPIAPEDRDAVAKQLVAAHQRLTAVLDPAWQKFLALPPDMTSSTPSAHDNLRKVQTRFSDVVSSHQFKALVDRQEFQETLTLLNRYALLQEASSSSVIPLPPPPK